MVLLLVSVN